MLASCIFALALVKGPELVSYEYVGTIGTDKATLTIDWPKGSAKKLAPKLSGTLFMGPKLDYFVAVGSNKSKGHIEFKLLKNKKSVASLRIMRDPKTPKTWIGDFYVPNKKPVPVRLKCLGLLEFGC